MSSPGEQDQMESGRVPSDQNGLPIIKIAQHPASPMFNEDGNLVS